MPAIPNPNHAIGRAVERLARKAEAAQQAVRRAVERLLKEANHD